MADGDYGEWATNSNRATRISMVDSEGKRVCAFRPEFTYPIFGESETIFGYKGLRNKLTFSAHDLTILHQVSYDAKISSTTGAEATDVVKTMTEFLPSDTLHSADEFKSHLSASNLPPPGVLVKEISLGNATPLAVYKASLADSRAVELVRRLQIFTLFFIEGGSYIDETDDRWILYTLWRRRESSDDLMFCGYCTVYPYFFYMPSRLDAVRARISQFVILPPLQHVGAGGALYDAVMDDLRAQEPVMEITVEDPSEAFEDLRDRRDLRYLASQGVWESGELQKTPLNKSWLDTVRREYKLAPRQFMRCVEMALLFNMTPRDIDAAKRLRLLVKQRLYRQNKEVLDQIEDAQERKQKLQETYQSVLDDYRRITEMTFTPRNQDNASNRPPKRARQS